MLQALPFAGRDRLSLQHRLCEVGRMDDGCRSTAGKHQQEQDMTTPDMKETVRRVYGDAARRATAPSGSCCGPSRCCGSPSELAADIPISSNLCDPDET